MYNKFKLEWGDESCVCSKGMPFCPRSPQVAPNKVFTSSRSRAACFLLTNKRSCYDCMHRHYRSPGEKICKRNAWSSAFIIDESALRAFAMRRFSPAPTSQATELLQPRLKFFSRTRCFLASPTLRFAVLGRRCCCLSKLRPCSLPLSVLILLAPALRRTSRCFCGLIQMLRERKRKMLTSGSTTSSTALSMS